MSLFKKTNLILISTIMTLGMLTPVNINANTISNNTVGKINVTSDETSNLLTYEELVLEVMQNEKLSREDAEKFLGISNVQRESRDIKYRTLKAGVHVKNSYYVEINFYCKMDEYNNFRGILEVIRASLNRDCDGVSKQFSGDLFVHLENAYTIYYELNGDFYNNGTTTYTGELGLQMDQMGSISYNVSYASNHYEYVFKTSRISLY